MTYTCRYCEKSFQRENTLAVHVCEQKKRYQQEKEVGVQIGLKTYLRFYEVTQGSSRLKSFDDFAKSSYYRAFVKFGRYCVNTRVINVPRFVDWLLKNNKNIDRHWCSDQVYGEYLLQHLREEAMEDALARAMEESISWGEETGHPDRDFLRYGNRNRLCHAITTGRISAWILYNCESGQSLLSDLDQEQIAIVWPYIDTDYWQKRFSDYAADTEYVRALLAKAGW